VFLRGSRFPRVLERLPRVLDLADFRLHMKSTYRSRRPCLGELLSSPSNISSLYRIKTYYTSLET
jgi:hypothetical protein